MTEGCTYLQLYDAEAGGWTQWGETVREATPYDLNHLTTGNLERIMDRVDGDTTEAVEAFRERYDIPAYEAAPDAITRDSSNAKGYRYKLLATKVFLDEHDIEPCPHEPHGDEEYCIYHLPAERKEALGIDTVDVRDALLRVVNTSAGPGDGAETTPNYFVGARLRELQLDHEILDPDDNFPIDLRFATVDRLALDDTEINQGLEMDHATVGEVEVRHADIRRDVTFDDAVFQRDVVFENVTVTKGKVSFRDAVFRADRSSDGVVSFENSTFGGREVNFHGTTCHAREARFASTDFDGRTTTFAEASFVGDPDAADPFDCTVQFDHSSFTGERTNLRGVEVTGDANFDSTRFDDKQTDLSRAEVGGTIRFNDADFNYDVTFKDATFGEGVEFDGAGCNGPELRFTGIDCGGAATFRNAAFDGGVAFSDATFDAGVDCRRTTFGGVGAGFDGVTFGGPARFDDAAFTTSADFTAAVFRAGATFDDARFGETQVAFREARFEGRATFERARFEAGADFTSATFVHPGDSTDGPVSPVFRLANHVGGVLTFQGATFRSGVRFDRARLEGREVDFRGARFDGGPTTDGLAASFEDCTFATDRAGYEEAAFYYGDLNFESAVFEGCAVSFENADIHGLAGGDRRTRLNDIVVRGGRLDMLEVRSVTERFDLTDRGEQFVRFGFPERQINEAIQDADDVQVVDISPESGAADAAVDIEGILDDYTLLDDDPLLDGSLLNYLEADGWLTVEGDMLPNTPVTATPVEQTEVEASLAALGGMDADGEGDAEGAVSRRGVRQLLERGLVEWSQGESDAPIELNGAHIETGRLVQPGVTEADAADEAAASPLPSEAEGTAYTTIYELKRSVVGNVHLDAREDQTAFECFEFQDTTFDGFEFNDHKEELRANQWTLHRTVNDGTEELSWPNRALRRLFLSSPVSAATRERFTPRELESTYLKAKSGADQAGDNSVASAFFQKELQHRRRYHREQIDLSVAGAKSLYSYVANLLLGLTSGYGERPGRVIVFSLLVIGLFGLVFQLVWDLGAASRPEHYAGLVGALLLSFESFTTLVLGGGNVDDVLVRYIAYGEGFTGAFLIALFVFTLTRSVHR